MRRRFRDRLAATAVCLVALIGLSVLTAAAAVAHPLGNFTVNYYSEIRVQPEAILVDLVIDRAEIPTLQAFPGAAIGQQPPGAGEWKARECAAVAGAAKLTVAGEPQSLTVVSSRLDMLPGAAGLPTSRLECSTRTQPGVKTLDRAIAYEAAATAGRVGWHEVTARGDGVTLADSTVPVDSMSKRLTAYPQDLLASPLDQTTARFTVRPGSGQVQGAAVSRERSSTSLYGLDRLTTSYTELISRTSLTPGLALLAVLLAGILGALHAFAPGHGKTLMAAYLVGREGTWRQAAVIGVSVTVTHTIGVLLLGAALSVAAIAAPEQVYPWLGLVSGILLVGIGLTLVQSARRGHVHGPDGHTHGPGGHTHGPGGHTHGQTLEHALQSKTEPLLATSPPNARLLTVPTSDRDHGHDHNHDHDQGHVHGHDHGHGHDQDHDHDHAHGHGHDHAHGHGHEHDHGHGHDHDHNHVETPATPRRRRMLSTGRLAAVGLVGGMVPSPSALLVLLGGIALGRTWFGVILVVAYGAGMAAALVGTGLLLVSARDRLERWSSQRSDRWGASQQARVLRLTQRLPMVTAMIVVIVGAWIAIGSLGGL